MGPSWFKDFIKLSVSYFKRSQNRKLSTYTTQITVLYMNRQEPTLLTTKLQYKKSFCNCPYQGSLDLYWPCRILFNLRATSHFPPSLLKSLGSSMNNGSPIGTSAWENTFVNSIICLYKPIIHCKIDINFTLGHCTTGEYEFRGSGVQGFRIQYILDIPSPKKHCLEFPDHLSRFTLALEIPCSWKHIVVNNWNLQIISHL